MSEVSCYGQSTTKNSNSKAIHRITSNCYLLKPIKKDIEYKWFDNLPKIDTNIVKYVGNFDFSSKLKGDTIMFPIVMSFERQKKIYINEECLKYLNNPDTTNLVNIYFSSNFNTYDFYGSNVEFVSNFNKNIFNLGNCTIYRYHLRGVALANPQFFFIIIPDKKREDPSDDYVGFVLHSDDIEWQELKNTGQFVPIFINQLRLLKLKIPLYFDGDEFISFGHFIFRDEN